MDPYWDNTLKVMRMTSARLIRAGWYSTSEYDYEAYSLTEGKTVGIYRTTHVLKEGQLFDIDNPPGRLLPYRQKIAYVSRQGTNPAPKRQCAARKHFPHGAKQQSCTDG